MNFIEVIENKRNKKALSEEEIRFFINSVTDGSVPDYQISALLMAIYLNGMSDGELSILTDAMAKSGDRVDLSYIDGIKVDKHSSGGVGDKVTLAVAPMVSACGLTVAKMSGRGLGFSGGTIDKLESIPGFRTALSEEEFVEFIKRDGIALMGQTKNVAPADKKIYALRDVTGTVESIPLIAASIMSKKLACGSDSIVLDVKCGSGAFMKSFKDAAALAEKMEHIGRANGRSVYALITNMDQPLGRAVGNALEVKEAIDILKGSGPNDVTELCFIIGSFMLLAGKKSDNLDQARQMLEISVKNGSALEKFKRFIENQGGDPRIIHDPELLPSAKTVITAKAPADGTVTSIDGEKIGTAALTVRAGRILKNDVIDHSSGFVLLAKTGDKVSKGQALAEIHAPDKETAEAAERQIVDAYGFSGKPEAKKLLLGYFDREGLHIDQNKY